MSLKTLYAIQTGTLDVASLKAVTSGGGQSFYFPNTIGVDISEMAGYTADFRLRGNSISNYKFRIQESIDGVGWFDVFSYGLAAAANSGGIRYAPATPAIIGAMVRMAFDAVSVDLLGAISGGYYTANLYARSVISTFQ